MHRYLYRADTTFIGFLPIKINILSWRVCGTMTTGDGLTEMTVPELDVRHLRKRRSDGRHEEVEDIRPKAAFLVDDSMHRAVERETDPQLKQLSNQKQASLSRTCGCGTETVDNWRSYLCKHNRVIGNSRSLLTHR